VPEVPVVVQRGGQPGHVVVPDERLRELAVEERVVPPERVIELEEVPVVERGPDRLPHLVLGDRVEPGLGRVGGVVPVDHLPEEPGLGERFSHRGQRLGPELRLDRVGGVEPPPAGTAAEPVAHHLGHVGEHRGLVVVELDELAVPFEDREVAGVRPALEPAGLRRRRSPGERRLERREPAPDVIEHPVQDQPQATLASRGHQRVKVGVVAEPRVDAEIVGGVVPVGLGREDRSQEQPAAAELDRVVEPRLELPEPVPDRLVFRQRGPLRAGEAKRVHMPQDGVISPGRHPVHGTGCER